METNAEHVGTATQGIKDGKSDTSFEHLDKSAVLVAELAHTTGLNVQWRTMAVEREQHCRKRNLIWVLVIFDFLHHGIEEVERDLLLKPRKKFKGKVGQYVTKVARACIGFLYKVEHKIGRRKKVQSCSRDRF